VIKGIAAVSGLVTTLAGATISAALLTALGYLSIIAVAGVSSLGVGQGLADQFNVGGGTPIQLPEAAQRQISQANPENYADLVNRYADRTSDVGFGPERTARINPETGRLYSQDDMVNGIIQNANINSMSQGDLDRRFFMMNSWDSTWG